MAEIVLAHELVRSEAVYRRRVHFLLRRMNRALRQWNLINDGDRILLGLSGGKDSLTLLHLLLHLQTTSAVRFQLAALHVQIPGYVDGNERFLQLENHTRALGVQLNLVSLDSGEELDSSRSGFICFRCAWNRRKELFRFARQNGFNKVALAHHLDDAAETVLMNLLFHASLETMEPKVDFFQGLVQIIRPLILAEEKEIIRVSSQISFPFFDCACPPDHGTEREHVKQFIRSFGRRAGKIKRNLWRASRTWREADLH